MLTLTGGVSRLPEPVIITGFMVAWPRLGQADRVSMVTHGLHTSTVASRGKFRGGWAQ